MDEVDCGMKFPASVVKVIDDYKIVINRGSADGVKPGDKFLVYYVEPEELTDPESGESLGHLEIVRGPGIAIHVQPRMTTLESSRKETKRRITTRSQPYARLLGGMGKEVIEEPEHEEMPFDGAQVNDKVQRV